MSVERFWLWADVLRRIAQAGDEDNGPSPDNRWLVPNNLMCTQLATAAAASSAHVEELRADIARKANDWKRECEGMALRLSKGDRNWKTFITFFDALFFFLPNAGETPNPDEYPCLPQEPVEVKKEEKAEQNGDAQLAEEPKEPAAPAAKVPFTVEETRKFVQKIAESDDEKFPKGERAGHLGVLELEKRLRKSAFASGDSPNFVDLIISYSKLFASKPVLPEDILPYLLELEDGEERSKWDAHVESIALETGDNDSLQQTINILKIQRLLSTSQSVTIESEQEFAKTCLKHYIAGLPLGKDLVSTDLQPVDDLALMAATALINVHHLSTQANCTEDSDEPSVAQQKYAKHLLDALVALEYAAGKSRWAYSMRLLLVRLHRLLGSSGLAMQNFTMANLKSIQFDTLSHHILDRASTFSLASVGDLTLVNECVESSQIYGIHGNEVSEQLVKAFQYERYSQIAEFVLLEEKVDNSLQRDLTKLEHFRMKNIHEGLTPESVEVELVELRFVWGRVHHDNRDFETLSNMLPRGSPSLDELTSVGGKKLSESWFRTMLQLWILVLHQTSEQLWTEEEQVTVRPKLLTFSDEALQELTPAERLLVKYGRALIAWLEPHHTPIKHSVMTSAVSTLATAKEKYAASTANGTANPSASAASSANTPSSGKSKSGANRKPNGLSNGTEGTAASSGEGGLGVKVGDMKVFTGMLTLHEPMEVPPMPKDMGEAVKEPPQDISTILDGQ
ncbi:hypothetical protein FS842_004654 [Serendipita sp. 407]|nr:hypothetical protein FS842_004654 [Serendipita sp. 407]